jgi:Ser/Thr protein kinase RdoA (MazF antagonist)
MDDAGTGLRGTRAEPSSKLLDALGQEYGIAPAAAIRDLGGSSNLNLLVDNGGRQFVVRVYRPSVSADRIDDIQRVRRTLTEHGYPCVVALRARNGSTRFTIDGRYAEVEQYVEHDARMNTWHRVEDGLRVLGPMHGVMETVRLSAASHEARYTNYIAAEDVVERTALGAERMRSWRLGVAGRRIADDAEELARAVSFAYAAGEFFSLPRQLAHGDFWDNNVLYRDGNIALIHDFDQMSVRPRIDDLALTYYYMNAEPDDLSIARRRALLRRLVGAYDSGLSRKLTEAERAAIPIAVARQPLWSIGGWVVDLDDQRSAQRHAYAMGPALKAAIEIMRTLPAWQRALR